MSRKSQWGKNKSHSCKPKSNNASNIESANVVKACPAHDFTVERDVTEAEKFGKECGRIFNKFIKWICLIAEFFMVALTCCEWSSSSVIDKLLNFLNIIILMSYLIIIFMPPFSKKKARKISPQKEISYTSYNVLENSKICKATNNKSCILSIYTGLMIFTLIFTIVIFWDMCVPQLYRIIFNKEISLLVQVYLFDMFALIFCIVLSDSSILPYFMKGFYQGYGIDQAIDVNKIIRGYRIVIYGLYIFAMVAVTFFKVTQLCQPVSTEIDETSMRSKLLEDLVLPAFVLFFTMKQFKNIWLDARSGRA